MLSSITALMQGLVDLVKVLKRPSYMVLAFALLAIGFELLAGGFWLRLFNWMLGGSEFREVLDTKLSEDPIQGTLGVFFILLSIWLGYYFERLRMTNPETHTKPKANIISSTQKSLLRAFQHNSFDRQHVAQNIDIDLLKLASQEPVNTVSTAYIRHIAQWVLHPKSINTSFTELSLLMDYGKDDPQGRFRITAKFPSLNAVLKNPEQQQHQGFVLLGRPGCGKSTLLKHLQYELSLDALTQHNESIPSVPFFIRLNEYPPEQDTTISPQEWLSQRWSQTYPNLPNLAEVQAQNGTVFLLDALNEMRCTDTLDYLAKVKRWKLWLTHLNEQYQSCRAIFTCRSLNYSESLSTETFTVPQIQFEDLSDGKIQEYLNHYLPNEGQQLFQRLQQVEGFSEFKTPFYLNLAIDYYQHSQDFTDVTPSTLIASMIWLAIERELQKTADKFSLESLTNKDRKRITHRSWLKAPHRLPDDGFLIKYLVKAAWIMQQGCSGSDSHQINISEALLTERLVHEKLNPQHIEIALELASDLELLERDLIQESCQFTHQILQEYFAAHEWVIKTDFSMTQQPYLVGDMQESLEDTINKLAAADPLPPPPPHGWEQTTLHAAAISHDVNTLIHTLAQHDVVLAARCAIQQKSQLQPDRLRLLQEQLLKRMHDSHTDLRIRIDTGLALGDLGDPRFQLTTNTQGIDFISPPLTTIKAGAYIMGRHSSNGTQLEEVTIPSMALGQYPVTNAEYACFINAGGYEDERWWQFNEDSLQWLRGELEQNEQINWYLQTYQRLSDNFDQAHNNYYSHWAQVRVESWKKRIAMSEADFDHWVRKRFQPQKYRMPAAWNNNRFNNPSQPVVGICWFEALAYCHWLSEQTGVNFSLPTEVEWCLVAQNFKQQAYPWGKKFDASKANTDEAHIRRTTPVGLYAQGATPSSEYCSLPVYDLSGNCWEWLYDLYQNYQLKNNTYETRNQYMTAGGAWDNVQTAAKSIFHSIDHPYDRFPYDRYNRLGFRILCVAPKQ